jgi:hypothetical protein
VTVSHRLGRTGFGKVVVMLAGGVTAVAGAGPGHGGDVGGRRHLRGVRARCLCGLLADLEAASNLLLAAALALSVGVRRLQVWQLWSAGALLGVATATKIWGVVPLLIIVAFLWHRDGRAVGGQGRVELLTI